MKLDAGLMAVWNLNGGVLELRNEVPETLYFATAAVFEYKQAQASTGHILEIPAEILG